MTPEQLKFEIAMLEDKKRRSSFPQLVFLWAYIAVAVIICLLIAYAFPGDSAPEWLLLLLAPAAMGIWFGLSRLVDHWAPPSDWTSSDRERLNELKRARFMMDLSRD